MSLGTRQVDELVSVTQQAWRGYLGRVGMLTDACFIDSVMARGLTIRRNIITGVSDVMSSSSLV